jgi:hypothetical protein
VKLAYDNSRRVFSGGLTAFGPLPSAWAQKCVRRSARRGSRCAQGPAAGSCCDGRRCAPTALCCSLWDRAAELTTLTSFAAFEQPRRVSRGCALRAPIPETALLAVTEIARCGPLRTAPAARHQSLLAVQRPTRGRARFDRTHAARDEFSPGRAKRCQRGRRHPAGPGGGDFWGDEQRRPGVGARGAHPRLTRRGCLSAVSAANEASSAARRQAEQRSGVGASLRPPQHEPPPGPAGCRLPRHADAWAHRGRSIVSNGPKAALPDAWAFHASRIARSTVEALK